MNEWHLSPEVPDKQAQYLIEEEIEQLFTHKVVKIFNVDTYFIVEPGQKCNHGSGWQCHPNGRGIIRWMEIPK